MPASLVVEGIQYATGVGIALGIALSSLPILSGEAREANERRYLQPTEEEEANSIRWGVMSVLSFIPYLSPLVREGWWHGMPCTSCHGLGLSFLRRPAGCRGLHEKRQRLMTRRHIPPSLHIFARPGSLPDWTTRHTAPSTMCMPRSIPCRT